MSRTLLSVLSQLTHKRGLSIKVGSKGGNGFWYCHLANSTTIRDINEEYLKIRKREHNYLLRNIDILNNLDEYYEKKITTWLNNKKNKKKTKAKRDEWVAKQLKLKESDRKRLPTYIKQLEYDTTHPFLEREIVEMVDGVSPDEPNTKVIYIKGYERGSYWTLKEYTKAHLPKELQRDFNVRLPKLGEREDV